MKKLSHYVLFAFASVSHFILESGKKLLNSAYPKSETRDPGILVGFKTRDLRSISEREPKAREQGP